MAPATPARKDDNRQGGHRGKGVCSKSKFCLRPECWFKHPEGRVIMMLEARLRGQGELCLQRLVTFCGFARYEVPVRGRLRRHLNGLMGHLYQASRYRARDAPVIDILKSSAKACAGGLGFKKYKGSDPVPATAALICAAMKEQEQPLTLEGLFNTVFTGPEMTELDAVTLGFLRLVDAKEHMYCHESRYFLGKEQGRPMTEIGQMIRSDMVGGDDPALVNHLNETFGAMKVNMQKFNRWKAIFMSGTQLGEELRSWAPGQTIPPSLVGRDMEELCRELDKEDDDEDGEHRWAWDRRHLAAWANYQEPFTTHAAGKRTAIVQHFEGGEGEVRLPRMPVRGLTPGHVASMAAIAVEVMKPRPGDTLDDFIGKCRGVMRTVPEILRLADSLLDVEGDLVLPHMSDFGHVMDDVQARLQAMIDQELGGQEEDEKEDVVTEALAGLTVSN